MAVAGSEAAAWIRKQARCPASQAMIKPRNQRWPFKKNAPELEASTRHCAPHSTAAPATVPPHPLTREPNHHLFVRTKNPINPAGRTLRGLRAHKGTANEHSIECFLQIAGAWVILSQPRGRKIPVDDGRSSPIDCLKVASP
jgi:hypothetical protein